MSTILAHRGASGEAPENTMEAFFLAEKQKADGIELDVHLSRDGEIVVIHDDAIDRTSGAHGMVREMTLAELRQHNYNVTHPEYAHANIPTLREVFEWAKPAGMEVNIELKTSPYAYEGIERMCIELSAKMGMDKQVCYSSFNHRSLLRVKEIDPSQPCGILYSGVFVRPFEYVKSLGMDALHPHYVQLMETDVVKESHAAGILVNPWTVDSEEHLRLVLLAGTDKIITNYPARARAIMEAL